MGIDIRLGVLNRILSLSIKRFLAVSRRKLLEQGEKTRDADDGAHEIVHEGCLDNDIGPVVWML